MSRVRNSSRSSNPVTYTFTYSTVYGGSGVVGTYPNRTIELERSSMNDSIQRSSRVHPCDHTVLTWHPQDVGLMTDPMNGGVYWERFAPPIPLTIGQTWDSLLAHGVLNPPSSGVVGAAADDALMEFVTQVPQEVDVFNFLLDFKEIGSLIPKLQKSMAATVSGGYLSLQFGWLPMMDDLKKLSTLTNTVAARLNWLKRTRGQRVRLGFYKELEFPNSAKVAQPEADGSYSRVLTQSKAEFRANGTLYHKLEGLDGAEGTLRGMIAALGLNSPSRVAWERIPFSFLVDYFARTQHIAESFTVQPFTGHWEVSNVTSSIKLLFDCDVAWIRRKGPTDRWVIPVGKLRGKRYFRYIGLPVSSSKFLEEGLSPKQLAIMAALVAGSVK